MGILLWRNKNGRGRIELEVNIVILLKTKLENSIFHKIICTTENIHGINY